MRKNDSSGDAHPNLESDRQIFMHGVSEKDSLPIGCHVITTRTHQEMR